jgi:DNA-binding NtrC family response regulator
LALVRHGYNVLQAANAPEALRCWAQQVAPVDLLICGLDSAGLAQGTSGSDLAAQLRDCQPALKIILTGDSRADLHLTNPGAQTNARILQTPFSTEQLLNTVRACLEGVRL